jgi:uncharacterized protein with von Willebrand factor type A (vWA) domain
MAELADELLAFGRALRREGVATSTGQLLAFSEAVAATGPADIYWAGRATLLVRVEDVAAYDVLFRRFWAGREGASAQRVASLDRIRALGPGEAGDDAPDAGRVQLSARAGASALEVLREKSFSAMTETELRQLARLMSRLRISPPLRRSRRRRRARTGEVDLRRTMRASMRTGGEPFAPVRRRPRLTPRRLVLILDVSASMLPYSRALMLFAHAALRASGRCEVFCFSTRLTRVSTALTRADPDAALAAAAAQVEDWDGGTRIGASIKAFLDGYGHRGTARGAVVVVCSDGLDVGDPGLLGEQMERVARLAHRVVWINPLQEQEGYEPLAQGMRAALPHVDTFASGHSLASLEALTLRDG